MNNVPILQQPSFCLLGPGWSGDRLILRIVTRIAINILINSMRFDLNTTSSMLNGIHNELKIFSKRAVTHGAHDFLHRQHDTRSLPGGLMGQVPAH